MLLRVRALDSHSILINQANPGFGVEKDKAKSLIECEPIHSHAMTRKSKTVLKDNSLIVPRKLQQNDDSIVISE